MSAKVEVIEVHGPVYTIGCADITIGYIDKSHLNHLIFLCLVKYNYIYPIKKGKNTEKSKNF